MDKCCLTEEGEIKAFVDRLTAGLFTALPGVIVAFDPVKCLATVKPAIRMKVVTNQIVNGTPTATVQFIDLPVVEHVPICLPHSATGGLFLTVPILPGDQCLLVFAQRGIDNVVDAGGVQNAPDSLAPAYSQLRHHDMTDAICIPGFLCVPNAISGWSQTALELRSKAGTTTVSVQDGQVTIQQGIVTMVVSERGVQITGNVKVTGDLQVTGQVEGGTVELESHVHGGVEGGEDVTGGPQAP